jgi:hypothetical protein
MEPRHERGDARYRRAAWSAASIGVFALQDLDTWLIDRYRPDLPAVWDTRRWPWIGHVEALVPTIRTEIETYLAAAAIPHVAEVSGLDPESDSDQGSIPLEQGVWRTVHLFANGTWVDELASHFPVTVSCFDHVHPKANVGFSILEGRSHIHSHTDPNRGALRFQLPIIVPGSPGECRIRIGDAVVDWKEGEAVVFDLFTDHEVWNEADGIRVLLIAEIPQPLPVPLKWVNRATQYSYRFHPSYRRMPDRIAEYGRARGAATAP